MIKTMHMTKLVLTGNRLNSKNRDPDLVYYVNSHIGFVNSRQDGSVKYFIRWA
jgi:hypothetical protein